MKLIVILFLLAIVAALAMALVGVLRPGDAPRRTVRALTLRIGLSALLFGLLWLGVWQGWWRPHGV